LIICLKKIIRLHNYENVLAVPQIFDELIAPASPVAIQQQHDQRVYWQLGLIGAPSQPSHAFSCLLIGLKRLKASIHAGSSHFLLISMCGP
jgi:hypothetical protein